MKCEECEAEFSPRNKVQRFCSEKCRNLTAATRWAKCNPEKARAFSARWRRKNPEKARLSRNRANNRIRAELKAKRESELGPAVRCQICGDSTQTLHWDHNHDTGLGRGWLCRGCNSGLGMFGDNTRILASAIEYLTSRGAAVTRPLIR